MIREKLRSVFMKWAFGSDPAPMLENLRMAVAAVQATRADHWILSDKVERLERVAIVAVDPLDGEELRRRVDPYLDATGVFLCTSSDAQVARIRPLERLTVS